MPKKLVRIEDTTLRSILSDPRIVSSLPCIAAAKKSFDSIAPGGTNCGRCQARKNKIRKSALTQARLCLQGLSGQNLKNVKKLLGADQIQFLGKNAAGKRVQFTK